MPYLSGADLKSDVLFRAGETEGATEWSAKVMDYINRVYVALASGASEFLPEFVDDWWWLRATGAITYQPAYQTGTVSVTADSTSIQFSGNVDFNATGQRIRIQGNPDVFVIEDHIAGTDTATIDVGYTGATDATTTYTLFRITYDLPAAVDSLMSPINSFRGRPIIGMTPERMDSLFPLSRLSMGFPQAFALENERVIRFSHGGLPPDRFTQGIKLEFGYRPLVVDLSDDPNSLPLVPPQFRHVLADMALTYMYMDKDDTRAPDTMTSARAGLVAMVKKNRRQLAKMDHNLGRIITRPTRRAWPQTESGLYLRT